eukprot:CAMPEP_0204149520 /NCGR_PEP_ID=MMETSP0361-20130328/24473_1 /ASSEMBLY_ACC=CAM_ASM_000343 /TAXON_ID=268821 /ORGANISM="Scrippsiella Hangoei, Strain SHTV-5" /LENGTH=38 /DNA_ID= /DNA_START= /DNA_END= /DNA_ORIENTATION=
MLGWRRDQRRTEWGATTPSLPTDRPNGPPGRAAAAHMR